MEKTINVETGKTQYWGEIMGFKYSIQKDSDEAFELWLKAKLERYILGELELKMLKEIVGIKGLEDRITTLEKGD